MTRIWETGIWNYMSESSIYTCSYRGISILLEQLRPFSVVNGGWQVQIKMSFSSPDPTLSQSALGPQGSERQGSGTEWYIHDGTGCQKPQACIPTCTVQTISLSKRWLTSTGEICTQNFTSLTFSIGVTRGRHTRIRNCMDMYCNIWNSHTNSIDVMSSTQVTYTWTVKSISHSERRLTFTSEVIT